MPNDAKLGLIVGVGLVIGVAVVYFRKDLPDPPGETAAYAAPVSSTRAAPANPRGAYRPVRAKAVNQGEDERDGERDSQSEQKDADAAKRRLDRPDRLP